MPSYPCASQRRFNRRMWRGEYPKMSAACSHVSRPSIAFTITSFAVIALASRATAASIRIATTYPARRTSLSAYDADIFSALYMRLPLPCRFRDVPLGEVGMRPALCFAAALLVASVHAAAGDAYARDTTAGAAGTTCRSSPDVTFLASPRVPSAGSRVHVLAVTATPRG